jgi:hypothetical protein
MMSYRPSVSLRMLSYSSPELLHPDYGVPLGETGASDNVLTLELALLSAVGFEGPPSNLVFLDGFETGTTEPWSSTE